MKLSIVIVNYNVAYFLEQCLASVYKALDGIAAEVFVVDNNSVDNSLEMLAQKFPQVKLIANKINTGFSVANNQAIKESSGEYVLLLNPDTLVQEDTFEKVISFMDAHADAGGLGIKMIDGKGKFLPESKRGLPTPAVAFYKIFGLSKLFPNSKRFGQYHLGYLDKEQNHEVDVLSGAFMLLRKKVLDKIGLLDETFFMYGEDIDLSYRITLAGYKNYYFAESQIIHYKGESTKKGSLNYVFVFYKAMVIFAQKHFSANNARFFSLFINSAIWFRASLAVIYRFVQLMCLPVADAAVLSLSLWPMSQLYEQFAHKTLQQELLNLAFPSIAIFTVVVLFFIGIYDRPYQKRKVAKAVLLSLVLTLTAYSLLPEAYRFSRALIIATSLFLLMYVLISRQILAWLKISFYGEVRAKSRSFVILGREEEVSRVSEMIKQANPLESVFFDFKLDNIAQLNDFVRINKVDEIVFCAKDMSAQQIIEQMTLVENPSIDFKIAPPESLFIIGSNSIDAQGDYYLLEMTGINSAVNQRNKRLFDLILCLLITVLSPLVFILQKQKNQFFKHLLLVWVGELTWVGFNKLYSDKLSNKQLKKGVVCVASDKLTSAQIIKQNLMYAKAYSWIKDFNAVVFNYRHLG